jgi:hypothetical protein
MVSFVALSSMPPTVLQAAGSRWPTRPAGPGAAAGRGPVPGRVLPADGLRESWKALRQAVVVSAGLAPVLGRADLLPSAATTRRALAFACASTLAADAPPAAHQRHPRHAPVDPVRRLLRLARASRGPGRRVRCSR